MKRDLSKIPKKEAHMKLEYQVRQGTPKETYVHEKRPTDIKRDLQT